MAIEGLADSKIWLRANNAAIEQYTHAVVTYTWIPVDGKVEQDIGANLFEDWKDERITADLDLLLMKNDEEMDTNFLLNTFLNDSDKQYREDSWGSYIDIVVDQKKVKIKPYKDKNVLGKVSLHIEKKTIDF